MRCAHVTDEENTMADGVQTYNYTAIQAATDHMAQVAKKFEAQAQDLTDRTKELMRGHWEGASADDYGRRSQQLNGAIDGAKQYIGGLQNSVNSGAEGMQTADQQGANF
jgi:WXG100 family type VII secretion target